MATFRLISPILFFSLVSRPSTVTLPYVGTYIPFNNFARVDFPDPLGPIIETKEPASTVREKPVMVLSSLWEEYE